MGRAVVDDGVDSIQAERVDVKVANPLQRRPDDELADMRTVWAVVVDPIAPRGFVAGAEIGSEIPQIVSLRTEVVVDDVETDGQPQLVSVVDEPLQRSRSTVSLMDRIRQNAVVTPVPVAREGLQRHQLDTRHPQLREVIESLRGGI